MLNFVCLLLLGFITVFGCSGSDTSFRGTELPDLPVVDFTLTDQNQQAFTLSQQRGNVVVMFFGFTYCPDVCPMTLSVWKRVEDALEADKEKVRFVYITVDPERDTPEKMKAHLSIFSDNFIGLTGGKDELQQVYSGYGVFREKVPVSEGASGYIMNHTSSIYILDKNGRWRLKFSNDSPVEDMVHDIKLLLKNTESGEGE